MIKPYYDHKGITIYCGDCTEIMPKLKPIDLVLTDPPYGLDKRLSRGAGKLKNRKFRILYEGENWDKVPSKECFDMIFKLSNNQIFFGGNYFSLPPTRGIICWDKIQSMPTFSKWEYIWTSYDFPPRIIKLINRGSTKNRVHPTAKPLKLIRQLLDDFGSIDVLDPFVGSGTTLVAAKELGLKAIGIEKKKNIVK